MEFVLIGAGMGSEALLTAQAREEIERADTVLTTPRLADGLSGIRDIEAVPLVQLAERALTCEGKTAILLSGDTGFFSAAKSLRTKLCGHGSVRVLPGMSSLQVFCAKLGTSYDDAVLLSMHGREGGLLGAVSYNRKVFALTGGQFRADALCAAHAGACAIYHACCHNLLHPGKLTKRLMTQHNCVSVKPPRA